MRRILLACFLLAMVPGTVWSQRNPARAQQLLEKADTLLAQGNVRGATVTYERALEADRTLVRAYVELGKLAVEEEAWGRAADWFDDALERDEANLEAHYNRGIVHRELGRFRTPVRFIKERINWRDAEEHFERVLARDSSFQDVLYQYALLEQYRGEWERAFRLAHRQMALRPDAAQAYAGLFRMYTLYLVREQAEAWLQQQDSELSRFFQADLLRRQGKEREAEALYLDLLARPLEMPRAPIHLALARIYSGRDDPQAVQTQFWSAVRSIASKAAALLVFEDVKYILRDEELATFEQLTTPDEYQTFFRAVWAQRDPMPAAAENVRLAEHYRRLRYADEHFAWYRPRMQFNNPDRFQELSFSKVFDLNQEYNDKGLIYIRHGEADEVVITIANDNDDLFTERRLGSVREPLTVESWRYFPTPEYPEMIIHFSSLAGGNWRMVPDVGTFKALEDRIEWGPLYNPRVIEPARQMEMRDETQASIDAALATDRHHWPRDVEPLDVRPLVATFRSSGSETAVEVYFAFPVDPVAQQAEGAGTVVLETGAALHDQAWQLVEQQREDVLLRLPQPPGSASLGRFSFTVSPEVYHVAVHVLPEGTSLVGGQKFSVEIPDYNQPQLSMSDVLPASHIEPADGDGAYVRGAWRILPNPILRFPHEQPISLYFELYNLTFNAQDQTDYTIEYTLTSEKGGGLLRRLFGGSRTELSIKSPATGTDLSPVEVTQLDVSSADPGTYILTVTVTDELTGSTVTRTRDLILY